ncbi:MAG: hypothetical protein U9O97_02325 [Elusimicrobiota bacterium]|nr:hypothetical protein [Elusimicrobiota bacterium]
MGDFKMITCIVERGKAEKLIKKISSSAGYGVTSHYARGTGGFQGKVFGAFR